jgi:cytochrome b561
VLIKNTQLQFGLVTKLLHWVIALAILFLLWLGWYMVELAYFDKWYNQSLALHKALGVLILALAPVLLTWKLISSSPESVSSVPACQRAAASIVHSVLISLMFLIPVSGYLISTSAGKPVSFFGLVELPAIVAKNTDLRDLAITAHFYLAYGIAALTLAHVGAALKHQLIDRDGTLARMIWR